MLSIAFLSVLCLLTHELAHAFAAICCGGSVQEFALLSITPHVRVGGSFTPIQHVWICAAGSGGEALLFVLALIGAPRTRGGRMAIEVTGLFAAIELIGWTLSALAFPYGARDTDVWKLLTGSGLHPGWVLWVCAALAAALFVGYRTRVRAQL